MAPLILMLLLSGCPSAARPLSPTITIGYDPDEFIEGLAGSVAASRAP